MLAQKSVSASSNYDTFTWLTKIKLTSVRNHEGKMKKKEDLTIAAAQLERERERESERRKKKKSHSNFRQNISGQLVKQQMSHTCFKSSLRRLEM